MNLKTMCLLPMLLASSLSLAEISSAERADPIVAKLLNSKELGKPQAVDSDPVLAGTGGREMIYPDTFQLVNPQEHLYAIVTEVQDDPVYKEEGVSYYRRMTYARCDKYQFIQGSLIKSLAFNDKNQPLKVYEPAAENYSLELNGDDYQEYLEMSHETSRDIPMVHAICTLVKQKK